MNGLSFKNQHTGIIYGFLSQIRTLAKRFKTNQIIYCWDSSESKRKEIYPDYKNKRNKEELDAEEKEVLKNGYKQFNTIRTKILPVMGFNNNFIAKGYEADDIMAKIALLYQQDFVMVTADEDMYQILDCTDMFKPSGNILYTSKDFIREWGIFPEEWGMVKAIAGCSSDNVKGVVGVGNKTAAKYLLNKLKSKTKAWKSIKASTDIINRNKKLVILPMDGLKLKQCRLKKDHLNLDGFFSMCEKYGFKSFLYKDVLVTEWENFFKGDFNVA